MTPEILVNLVQLGATGLLALVLYFGLQANARMLEILAEALRTCQSKQNELVELLQDCNSSQEETD